MSTQQQTDGAKKAGTSKRTTKLKARSYGKKAVNFLLTFVMVTSLCFSSGLTALAEGVNDTAADQGIAAQADEGGNTSQATGFEEATPDASAVPDYYTVAGADEQQSGYTLYYYTLDGTNYYRVYGTVDGASIGYYAFDETSGVIDTSQPIDGAAEQQAIAGAQGADESTESGIAPMSEEDEGGIVPQAGADDITVYWKAPGGSETEISTIAQPSLVSINGSYQLHVLADFSDPALTKTRTVSIEVPFGYKITEMTGPTTTCGGTAAAQGVKYINTTDAQMAVTEGITITARDGGTFAPAIADSTLKDYSGLVTYSFKTGTEQVNMYLTLVPSDPGLDNTNQDLTDTIQTNPATTSDTTQKFPDIKVIQVSDSVTNEQDFQTIGVGNKTNIVYDSNGSNVDYQTAVPTSGGTSNSFGGATSTSYVTHGTPTTALKQKGDIYVITTIPAGCKISSVPNGTSRVVKSMTVGGATVPNSTLAVDYVTTDDTVVTVQLAEHTAVGSYTNISNGIYVTFDGVPGDTRTLYQEAFIRPYSETDPLATVNTDSSMNVGDLYLYSKAQAKMTLVEKTTNIALSGANGATYDYMSDYSGFPYTQALGIFKLQNSGNTAAPADTLHAKIDFDADHGVKGMRLPGNGAETSFSNITVKTSAGQTLSVADGSSSVNMNNNLGLADGEYITSIEYDLDQSKLIAQTYLNPNSHPGVFYGVRLNGNTDVVSKMTVTKPSDPNYLLEAESHTTPASSIAMAGFSAATGVARTYHPGESIPITATMSRQTYTHTYIGNEETVVNPTYYLRVPYLDENGNQLFDLDTTSGITGESGLTGPGHTLTPEFKGLQTATIDGKQYTCKIYAITTDTSTADPIALEWNHEGSVVHNESSISINFNLTAYSDNPATKNWNMSDLLYVDSNSLDFNGGVTDPTGQQTGHNVGAFSGQILMSPLPELSVAAGIKLAEDTMSGYHTWDTTYGSIVQIPFNHTSEIQMSWANNAPTSFGKGTVIYLPIPHKNQQYTNYFTGTNTTNKTEINAMFDSELDLNLTGPITLDKFDVEYATSTVQGNGFWDGSTSWVPVTGTWTPASGVSDWSKVVMVRFTANQTLDSGASGKTTFQATMGSDAASGDQAYVRPLSKGVTNEVTNSGTWVVGGIMAVEAQTSTLDGFVFDDSNGNGTFDKATESKDTTSVTLSISGTVKQKNSDGFPAGYVEGDKNTYTGKTTTTETDVDFGPTAITISSDGTYYVNDPNCPLAATGNIKYLPVGSYTLTSTIGDPDSAVYTTTGSSVITRTNTATNNNAMDFNKLTGTNGVWKSDVTEDGTDAAIATYDFTVERHATSNSIAGIGLRSLYTVTYKTDGNGTIDGAKTDLSETVASGGNPANVPATAGDTGYVPDGWTADVAVTLNDGTTIAAGSKITDDQISKIKVTSDITLTAKFKEQLFGGVEKTLKSVTDGGAIGGTAVYEVTVTNTGTSVMNGYKVVESPTGLTIDSVTGTDVAWDAGTKTITFNNVAANNGTKTATVSCTITADPFKNKVRPGDKDGDYTITKTRVTDKTGATEATGKVLNGDTVYYKLELFNGATAIDATGINITDTATNLSDGKYAADDAAFNGTWNTGAVAANAKASVVVKYTVADNCEYISNAITAPNGETDIITTPVDQAKQNVTVTKSLDDAGAIKVGSHVQYTVRVTNPGTETLTNVKVDEVFTGLTDFKVENPPTGVAYNATDQQLVLDELAPGYIDVTVTGTVDKIDFTNYVGNPYKTDFMLDKARVKADGSAVADTDKVSNGDTVYYKLSIENTGETDIAAGKVVSETFVGLSYEGVQGTLAGTVETDGSKWTAPAVAKGATESVILKFTVTDTAAWAKNTATCEDQTIVVTTLVDQTKQDVTFTKVLNTTGEIEKGDEVEYTITATNNSATALTNVKATEIPVGLTITGVTGTGITWASPTITFASITANGGTATATVKATVTADEFSNGVVSSYSKGFELDKQRVDATGAAATNKVLNGDTVYYKLSIKNTGETDIAAGKAIADTFDGLTYVGTEGTVVGTVATDGSKWTAPAVAKGATESVILKFTVNDDVMLATNTATCENQTVVVTTPVDRSQKDVKPKKELTTTGEIEVGDTVTYKITVTNPNTDTLTNVKMNETLTGLSDLAVTAPTTGVTYAGGQLVFASLPAGDTVVIVTAKVDTENFANGVTNPVPPKVDELFMLDKARVNADGSAAQGVVSNGETVYYKLSVENTGTKDIVAGKEIADTFSGLTYVGTEGTVVGTVATDGSKWTAPAVAKGATASVILKFTVTDDATITNNTATCEGQTKVVSNIVSKYRVDAESFTITPAAAIALFGDSTDPMILVDPLYNNATGQTKDEDGNWKDTDNIGQSIATADWAAIQAGTPGTYNVTYSNDDDPSGNTKKTVTITIGNGNENENYKVNAKDANLSPAAAVAAFGTSTDSMDLADVAYNNATAQTKDDQGTWNDTDNIGQVIDPADWADIQAGTIGKYPVMYTNDDDATGATKQIVLVNIDDQIVENDIYTVDAIDIVMTPAAAIYAFGTSTDSMDLADATYQDAKATTDGNPTTNIAQIIDPDDWSAIKAGTPGVYLVTYVNDDDATGNTSKTVTVTIGNEFVNGDYKVAAQDAALSSTAAKLAFKDSTNSMDLADAAYNNATAQTKDDQGTWNDTDNIGQVIDPADWASIQAGTQGTYPVTYSNDDDATGRTKVFVTVTVGKEIITGEYKVDATSITLTPSAAQLAFTGVTDPKILMDAAYNNATGQTKDEEGNWGDTTNISQVIDPADWAAIQAGTPGTYFVTYVNDDDPTGNTKKTVSVVIDDFGILDTGLTAHDFEYASGISSPEITEDIARQLAEAAGTDDSGNPITADKIIPDAAELAAINDAKDAGLTGPYPLTFVNSVTGEVTHIVVTLTGDPQITIDKVASVDKAAPGDTVTYTITATNSTEIMAKGVWVKDYVPANTTFVSCDAAGSRGTNNGREYVSWFADVEPMSSVSYTLTVKVNECQDGTGVDNIALYEITGGEEEPPDPSIDPTGGTSNIASFTVNRAAAYAKTSRLAKTGDDTNLMVLALGFASLACAAGALGLRRRRQY